MNIEYNQSSMLLNFPGNFTYVYMVLDLQDLTQPKTSAKAC